MADRLVVEVTRHCVWRPGVFVSIGCAGVGSDLHVAGVTSDGALWHTVRHQDSSWQTSWGGVRGQMNNAPGAFTAVSCSGVGDTLELVGVVGGRMWFTARNSDGTWQPFAVILGQGPVQ